MTVAVAVLLLSVAIGAVLVSTLPTGTRIYRNTIAALAACAAGCIGLGATAWVRNDHAAAALLLAATGVLAAVGWQQSIRLRTDLQAARRRRFDTHRNATRRTTGTIRGGSEPH